MTTPIVPSITDEDLAAVEQHAMRTDKTPNSATVITFHELQQLIARLRAAEKDAARYRFIKDECDRRWDIMYVDIEIIVPAQNFDDCDDLDGLIDAAMDKQP